MRDLFVTPAFQFLCPIFVVVLLVFLISTPASELMSIVEFFLPDHEFISNLNWKVYR